MQKKQKCEYKENNELNIQYLEIPLVYSEVSLLLFLPKQPNGLRQFESTLTSAHLRKLKHHSTPYMIDITLPKFKTETELDMVKLLQKIGITQLFGTNANLTGISANGQLYVNKGYHKTFIGNY